MANTNLANAKTAKNDEFYTQYADIQKEINAYLDYNPDVFRDKTVLLPCDDPEWSNFTKFFAQNFQLFGLKKLISTSYAPESKKYKMPYQPTLFETSQPHFNADKTKTNGKIFVLERDITGDNRIDINDLEWQYLEGDGDFRSKEVKAESGKQFVIIGSMNAVSYKEIFPLIKDNKMWMGNGFQNGNAFFRVEAPRVSYADGVFDESTNLVKFRNCCWFTNIDHGRRHQPLQLMSLAENFKHSKHKEIRGRKDYIHYENYDAIEVPYTDAIPSDFDGAMGVPLTFLDKYCPEQFEIIGQTQGDSGKELGLKPFPRELKKLNPSLRDGQLYYMEDGIPQKPYARILIRKKQ